MIAQLAGAKDRNEVLVLRLGGSNGEYDILGKRVANQSTIGDGEAKVVARVGLGAEVLPYPTVCPC